jgi:hypothetical protein
VNGPAHYERAERMMSDLDRQAAAVRLRDSVPRAELDDLRTDWAISLQAAQVHATLALAWATAPAVDR